MSDEFDIIQKELEAYKKEKEEAEKKHKEELEQAKKEAMELVKKEFEAKRLEEEKAKKEAILEAKVKDLETKSQVEIDALKSKIDTLASSKSVQSEPAKKSGGKRIEDLSPDELAVLERNSARAFFKVDDWESQPLK